MIGPREVSPEGSATGLRHLHDSPIFPLLGLVNLKSFPVW